MMDNLVIDDDLVYYVTENTKGLPGTFRHSLQIKADKSFKIIRNKSPLKNSNGLLGVFVFGDTPHLKSIIYNNYSNLKDLTDDVLDNYIKNKKMLARECVSVFEFGNESDLQTVRELWQNV
jgi:uncharacterized pyridoxamine 5'-phosphate oxidase family protein